MRSLNKLLAIVLAPTAAVVCTVLVFRVLAPIVFIDGPEPPFIIIVCFGALLVQLFYVEPLMLIVKKYRPVGLLQYLWMGTFTSILIGLWVGLLAIIVVDVTAQNAMATFLFLQCYVYVNAFVYHILFFKYQ